MSHIRDGKAKRILRAEMARSGVSYEELVDRLAKLGKSETSGSLRNKLSRGSFSADFFIGCLTALEVKIVRLED